MRQRVGIVIIGRNEGARLVRCLCTVKAARLPAVYVDSGSSDGSPDVARALGIDVVELDRALPFTAARGRNAGLRFLRARRPTLTYVQFIDGDTELVPGWIGEAARALDSEPRVAAVCGRRRERARAASIYNRLCDIEWDTPVGDAAMFGGDVMVRIAALEQAGGYDEALIAGEDPDLAVRLRRAGGDVRRLPEDMTIHDADMRHFRQWWRRAVRAGHAFAEGAHRHRDLGVWRREVRSNWMFGAALPLLGAGLAVPSLGASALCASLAWSVLGVRVFLHARARGLPLADALPFAAFTALAKLPQAVGQASFWRARLRGRRSSIIEYKAGPARTGAGAGAHGWGG